MIDPASIPQLNKHFRLQWEEAQGCYVLLYPEGMVKLNESAGLILNCVDGTKTVGAIIAELTGRFPQVEGIASDIEEFMTTASAQRWVAFS
ncbi:MAG: pyrroloquinoline quinone biosynthesis peptide chaperone PqqD [Luminiphilus sp.]|nr:pyrroloquinoline quinone biosynthesis peptide chaperone PqqD [Luminiphilus sp.]